MNRFQAAVGLIFALACATPPALSAEPPARSRPVDFNRDVRPILSETCFQCHGPDKAKRKGNLRLDTKEGAFAPIEGIGPVIVAGKPDESELVARVESDDADERMPPPESGRSLSKGQVEILRRWVAEGAEWKGHWAYLPPSRPEVPGIIGPPGFARNDVDRFVLEKLAEKGLAPSPEADRATLIRRLSFDLKGLPPSPSAVDAFVNDARDDAYERLVASMLASPHYGERMAAYWLDLVRYADTTGYHSDNHRDVTLYRDYVIDAFNLDMPFDRFTTEQLAGDLLNGPTDAQRVASGYNRLLLTTEEGGAQAKEYTAKYAADRVRNASTVWMGATLGCAECHDHKYDPYTTRDFYRFASFFADIQEVVVGKQVAERVPTAEQAARAKAIDAEVARLQAVLDAPTPALALEQAAWERTAARRPVEWTAITPEKVESAGGATLTARDDGSILASGENSNKDTYTLTFKLDKSPRTALRLEVLPDGSLPKLGPGRAENGNFVLSELEAAADGRSIAWAQASATHAQDGQPASAAIDGKLSSGWAILPEAGRPNSAVFEAKEDFGPCCEECGESMLTVKLRFEHGTRHTLGRFRLSTTDAQRPVRAEGLPATVAKALDTPAGARTEADVNALASYYRTIAPSLELTRVALSAERKRRADLEAEMPLTLVTRAGTPRTMRILPRGNWLDDAGPIVTPAVPEFLNAGAAAAGDDSARLSRLDLARWLVARENPLTARVFVNRVWALLFGQGIAASTDDLGAQGAQPTHPELLDWLAIEFMESGWDVKRLVAQIVNSGTYRQSSHADAGLRRSDPYNQWLARQGRFRLDAEFVRDNALAVSGLLAPQVGGGSARPYQPAGYWSHLNFPKREYQPDHGAGLYRRSLYTYWCRTFPHPSLRAFDAPSREECTVLRPRSNTPLQALVLLNDPIHVEAARALAERVLREAGAEPAGRVAWMYRNVLSRSPRPAEADVLSSLLEKHLTQYRGDRPAADALIHTGERPVPADIDPAELAAWTSVARVVLNLHETITRN